MVYGFGILSQAILPASQAANHLLYYLLTTFSLRIAVFWRNIFHSTFTKKEHKVVTSAQIVHQWERWVHKWQPHSSSTWGKRLAKKVAEETRKGLGKRWHLNGFWTSFLGRSCHMTIYNTVGSRTWSCTPCNTNVCLLGAWSTEQAEAILRTLMA